MEDSLECFYEDDWVKVEKNSIFFYKETDDEFINIKFYPFKIDKSQLFKLIYYNEDVNKIHSLKQCILDIPRYPGYIKTHTLSKFSFGDFSHNLLMIILKDYYSKKQITDIYNFIPQQIFYIVLKEILTLWEGCFIAKTEHQLNIDSKYVERILTGQIFEGENCVQKFISKLKLEYDKDFVTLNINFFK